MLDFDRLNQRAIVTHYALGIEGAPEAMFCGRH